MQELKINKAKIVLAKIVITRPGGNDTALVFDSVAEADYAEINARIMKRYPNVEQVMFVDETAIPPIGTMAGHEFCGNATRSLGYLMLDGKDGAVQVQVSGASAFLSIKVESGSAITEMPIQNNMASVKSYGDVDIAHLQGISHILCSNQSELAIEMNGATGLDQQKQIMLQAIKRYDLVDKSCVGIILFEKISDNRASIVPFVYVSSTGTFFAETACGSGSVAYALQQAKISGQTNSIAIRQPSGCDLSVMVKVKDNKFANAYLGGVVEMLYQGSAEI